MTTTTDMARTPNAVPTSCATWPATPRRLVVDVKKDGHELQARLRSLGYLDGAKKPLETNLLRYEWSLNRAGALQSLEPGREHRPRPQSPRDGGRLRCAAQPDGDPRRTGSTRRPRRCDDRRHAHRGSTETRPGLVLLRTQTATGALRIVI